MSIFNKLLSFRIVNTVIKKAVYYSDQFDLHKHLLAQRDAARAHNARKQMQSQDSDPAHLAPNPVLLSFTTPQEKAPKE